MRIVLADTHLAKLNYTGAAETLKDVLSRGEVTSSSVVLKAAVRISKIHRRLGEVFPSQKVTSNLAHGLQALDWVNDELRCDFLDEISRNIARVDRRNIPLYQQTQNLAYILEEIRNHRIIEDDMWRNQTMLLQTNLKKIERLGNSNMLDHRQRSDLPSVSISAQEAIIRYPEVRLGNPPTKKTDVRGAKFPLPLGGGLAYKRCGESVVGLWAKATHRKLLIGQIPFRVEAVFETPVLFVARPLNKRGPVRNMPIHCIDGTRESYENTRTLEPLAESQKESEAKIRTHTVDDERVSWLILLSTLQMKERQSRIWDAQQRTVWPPDRRVLHQPEYQLTAAIQVETKSWDMMPPQIMKLYATTALCHVVELMAMLGVHWRILM